MSAAIAAAPVRTALDLPHGIHLAVPHEVYHARVLGLASKSILDDVRRSPAHYYARSTSTVTPEESGAFRVGSALHCRMFEPDRFLRTYAVEPDFGDCRFKENKARRDAWRKDHEAFSLLSAEEDATTCAMVDALRAHPLASKLFIGGESEVTIRWRDPETGLECKSRSDYYVRSRGLIVDLKSTDDARPDAFRKTVARWGYHRQDSMYRDGFNALRHAIEHFVFVAQEKAPPYAISIFVLDSESVAKGRATIHADLRTLADCLERDQWPGYSTGIQPLMLPDWAE